MSRKNYFISSLALVLALTTSCHESMEDKAEREAKDYTRKYCPTPFVNYVRTDSVTFNKNTHSYTYHCSFGDVLDNRDIVAANRQRLHNLLRASIRESTSMKPYIEAGYHFHYVCRSASNPQEILIKADF